MEQEKLSAKEELTVFFTWKRPPDLVLAEVLAVVNLTTLDTQREPDWSLKAFCGNQLEDICCN